jgi:predicted RNA-binding Zn-ribbon protein involved in translation (DUF1610 family)
VARGKKCPECGAFMYARDEDEQPMGAWVVYVCSACGFSEKVFEPKR